MFVIESCQKIEYNALFMMIFIPVSNFGDQPLVEESGIKKKNATIKNFQIYLKTPLKVTHLSERLAKLTDISVP